MFMAAVLIIRKCVATVVIIDPSGEPGTYQTVHRIAVLCLMPIRYLTAGSTSLGCLLALYLRFGFMLAPHSHGRPAQTHCISCAASMAARMPLQIRGYAVKPAARNPAQPRASWLPLEQDPLYLSLSGSPYLILRIKPADEMHLFQPFLLHDIVETITMLCACAGCPIRLHKPWTLMPDMAYISWRPGLRAPPIALPYGMLQEERHLVVDRSPAEPSRHKLRFLYLRHMLDA